VLSFFTPPPTFSPDLGSSELLQPLGELSGGQWLGRRCRFTVCENMKLVQGALIDADDRRATVLLEGEHSVIENVPVPLGLNLAKRLEEGQELDCR
jgi:hypothetical protein